MTLLEEIEYQIEAEEKANDIHCSLYSIPYYWQEFVAEAPNNIKSTKTLKGKQYDDTYNY